MTPLQSAWDSQPKDYAQFRISICCKVVLFIDLAALGLHCCLGCPLVVVPGSSCCRPRLWSIRDAARSRCAWGLSGCGFRFCNEGSVMAPMGSSQTRAWTSVSSVGGWILYHWASRGQVLNKYVEMIYLFLTNSWWSKRTFSGWKMWLGWWVLGVRAAEVRWCLLGSGTHAGIILTRGKAKANASLNL